MIDCANKNLEEAWSISEHQRLRVNTAERNRLTAACDADVSCKRRIANVLPLFKELSDVDLSQVSSAQLIVELQAELQRREIIGAAARVLARHEEQMKLSSFEPQKIESKFSCLNRTGRVFVQCYALAIAVDPLLALSVAGKAPMLFRALGVVADQKPMATSVVKVVTATKDTRTATGYHASDVRGLSELDPAFSKNTNRYGPGV